MALHQLSTSPAPGFDAPLDMLLGCHGRILHFCDLLERLSAHLPVHGADAQARESAAAIMRYFNTAGRYHHQDEEQDLFPLMIAMDDGAKALIEDLLAAHTEMDRAWEALSSMLESLQEVDWEIFRDLAEAFISMNRSHVELENRDLLPVARCLLNAPQLEQLGRAMAKRRHVDYVSSDSGDMA